MRRTKYYHYFVEDENEEKIVNVLKTDLQLIIPGKVQKFNVVEQKLTKFRLMSLKYGTTVVLVFDTDTGKVSTLKENINFLKKESAVADVLCVMQVLNLEDEFKRSCNIRQIKELTNSKSNSDFKCDMLSDSKFYQKLVKHKFDLSKFWNTNAENEYKLIKNEAEKIKLKKHNIIKESGGTI